MRSPRLPVNVRAWLYLLPSLTIIAVFVVFPLVMAFRMGFYDSYNYYTNVGQGFGLRSFGKVLSDPAFHLSVRNTLLLAFGAMPVSMMISLMIALGLNASGKWRGWLETAYFLPYVTSVIALGIVFRWLFHSQYGLINYLLGLLGAEPVPWLNNPHTAPFALAIYCIWVGLPFKTIVFLAGLRNIPRFYENAARVDGAGPRRRFFRVTLPLLSPTILFLVVVSLIEAFKTYNEVYALFGEFGGPVGAGSTVVFYIYRTFYGAGRMHIAAAAAVILFLAIVIVTLVQFLIGKRYVHYR